MYPLFFKPIYKSTIWGGRNLEKLYKRDLPEGKIAESWEISCHGEDSSIILNGEFQGKTLDFMMQNYRYELLGKKSAQYENFPLLIKIIDACDRLSVQVHPDDHYAKEHECDSGKTEMWYIGYAKENARLILGLKPGVDREALRGAIEKSDIEQYLNYINVKEGDALYIPSGTVHAILDGIVLIEIQQSSNVTYRVYDWDRTDNNGNKRPLHIEKALDVINFDYRADINNTSGEVNNGYRIQRLVNSEFFNVEKIEIENSYSDSSCVDTFYTYTVINGSGKLFHCNVYYDLTPGTSFLIGSSCGEYKIEGSLSLLKAFI